jgi:hypothetical protein
MSNRRGMTLLLVLVMGALIGISAMLLFSTANMETMIAGNTRLSHFIAMRLDYNTLRERAGGLQTLQILPETRLSPRTSYEVKVHFSPSLNAGQYVVESIGYYTKGGDVISTHPIKALFEGEQ